MHKKFITYVLLFLIPSVTFSQSEISGIVVDSDKQPLQDVNVFVENSFQGTVTNTMGKFQLSLGKNNVQSPIKVWFTSIGFIDYALKLTKEDLGRKDFKITLKFQNNSLEEIFLQTKKRKQTEYLSTLSSLELITTPNALGDVMASIIKSYPGLQNNPQDGRFFVRGGDHYESKVFINQLLVHKAFNTTGSNIPSRSRFSPLLFDGISFSTGGFSAEYGNALSSILLLNTKKKDLNDEYEVSVKSVGIDASISKNISDKTNLNARVEYLDLGPYRDLFPSRYQSNESFNTISGEISLFTDLEKGSFNSYNKYDRTKVDYSSFNVEDGSINRNTVIEERNFYTNNYYTLNLSDDMSLFSGMTYSFNEREIEGFFSATDKSFIKDHLLLLKTKLNYSVSNNLKFEIGAEAFNNYYFTDYQDSNSNILNRYINNNQFTGFLNTTYKISRNLVFKGGLRSNCSTLLSQNTIAPRLRLEYKTTDNLTLSGYYGDFYQNPRNQDLIFDFNNVLKSEMSNQYGVNIYWEDNDRMLVLDAFRKEYNDLVKFTYENQSIRPSNFNNNGNGYAKGVDVFFSDRASIKNLDYRISYTYLDAKRDYQNYPSLARPYFYSEHNLSINTQFWLNSIRSLAGLNYVYTSGRPYTNPNNNNDFLNSYIKPFNTLDFSITYLFSQNLFIHSSISNILGFKNISDYRYGNVDAFGVYEEQEILPPSDHFFFIGVFYTFGGKSAKAKAKEL